MTVAMIMAGGRSSRMRAGGIVYHKGLVEVLGVPLVERNVCTLLAAGFRDIVVSIAAREKALQEFVETRCRRLAEARSSLLRCFVEYEPLGTIGAVRTVLQDGADVVVVNVDNLTTLDLRAMLMHHRAVNACMTVAVHWEPFLIPYGEVVLGEGWIQELIEKPVKHYRMSSGTYVLNGAAAEAFPAGSRIGPPELFERLKGVGGRIAAFEHQNRWIDVNDCAGVSRAEGMILADGDDYFGPSIIPDREVTALLVRGEDRIWLECPRGDAARYAGLWDLPIYYDKVDGRCIAQSLGLDPTVRPRFLLSFDDLDPCSGEFIRHHVFELDRREYVPAGPGEWIADPQVLALSPPAKRAIAVLDRLDVEPRWADQTSRRLDEMAGTGT